MQENKEVRLIKLIKLKNLLSFNDEGIELELKNLNVLIGANASGKSNFIEAISLLQNAPTYLAKPVKDKGGITTWLHKSSQENSPVADIEVITTLTSSHREYNVPIKHILKFTQINNKFELTDEVIEDSQKTNDNKDKAFFYYKFENNHPIINTKLKGSKQRKLDRTTLDEQQSILSQRKDPELYPELYNLAQAYENIRTYREWTFGRYSKPREAQKVDLRNDFLEENCENLVLILNKIQNKPQTKVKIINYLKELYPRFTDFSVVIEAGAAQIFFIENDSISVPATRLSDGTLRYLSLLAALYNPTDKSHLICIEEPELGLHPDIVPTLAEIFKEVSKEKQLIITTHSQILIDALSDEPESVIVCENEEGFSQFTRLDKKELEKWLEYYSLGELWSRGEIGGNRYG